MLWQRLDPLNILSADRPLDDPGYDRLGYSSFAKNLAESICKMPPAEGLVIAVYGPWGSGKTTLLNFVAYYLNQMPPDEQPVIVLFNPCWFSGHEDLTRRFFTQLQATLSKWESVARELTRQIGDFAQVVSETPIPYASTARPVAWVARLMDHKRKDVPELKSKIADLLKKQQKRILVIIDDIDSLTSEEIRQLFRVIKAVADFPNVVYLLAFDKDVAVNALVHLGSNIQVL